MAMFMHRKDNKIKVEFTITIHTLKNLPNTLTGHDIFVECKRGSKAKNHYNTKKITASGITNVTWEEKFKINSTFYEDPKTKKIDQKKKELTFTVKDESSKSKDKKDKTETVTFGKGAINLATFAEPNTVRHEAITLKTEKKASIAPTLMIKVESNWLKIGDKNLVKKTGSVEVKTPRGSNDKKEEIKIGNEDYVLQTADEVTDTQASDDEEDLEEDKLEDDDNKSLSSSSLDKKELNSSSSDSDIKYLKERYETEIQDLIKDRERLEKKVTRLTSEKEKAVENLKTAEAKAATITATSTSNNNTDQLEAEIEDLKTDKSRLESKVERLSKDLEQKKKEVEDSKNKDKLSEEEKNKLNNKIKELEKSLEEEKKSKASIQESLDKSTKKSSSSSSNRSSLEDKEVETLKKQLEESKKNIEDLKKQVEEYKSKAASVPTSPVVSSKDLDAAKKQVEDLKKQVEDFKKQVEELKKQNEEMKKTSKEATENVDRQKEEIVTLKREKEKLEKEKDKLNSQITATAAVAASTSKSNEQSKKLEDKVSQLEQEIEEKKEIITELKASKERLEEKVDNKAEKLLEYKKKVKELDDTRKSNEQAIAEKDNKLISLESKITSLQIELDSKSSAKSESKESPAASRLKELQAQNETLTKNMNDQKKDFSEKTSNYESKISDLQNKLQNAQSSGSTKEKELSRQIEELKKDYDTIKKRLREEEKAKTIIEEELATVRKRITELESSSSYSNSNNSSASSTPSQSKKEDEEEQLKKKIQAMRQEKEVETLKKKVSALQRENEERKLIESAIYAAEPEYDEETHIPTHVNTIIQSLVNWSSFDPPNEDLLSNIVSSIKKSFTRSAYDSEILAYWLSLTSSLYLELKKEVQDNLDLNEDFLTQQLLISDESQLDSMDPPVKFFYDLILLAFDIYSVLLINIYSQIDHILLPPLLEKSNAIIDSKGSEKGKKTTNDFAIILSDILKLLKKNFISETLQTHFMRQIFYFMDAQVFNTLLRKPELFTASNGFQIKMAISQVESQLGKVDKQLLSIAHNGLHHTREAANLLVMDKSIVSDEQTVSQIFSNLNIVQIKHILDKFKPDDLSPETIPPSVKQSLENAARRHADLPLQLDPMSIKKVNLFTK